MHRGHCLRSYLLLATTASLTAIWWAAAAPPAQKHIVASNRALEPGTPGGVAGFTAFESGFEPSEGCTLGYVGGGGSGVPQNCVWHASGSAQGTFEQPVISDGNPANGTQHLHFEYDSNQTTGSPDLVADAGSRNWAFSDDITPPPDEGVACLDAVVRLTGTLPTGNAYVIQPQAPTQALLTTVMVLNTDGNILVGDDDNPDDTTFAIVDSGADWSPTGAYVPIRIEVNVPDNAIRYWYDGTMIYSTAVGEGGLGVGIFAGTVIEHVLFRYEANANDGTTLDVDDVSIAPPAVPCPWDVDGDGDVDVDDLTDLILAWGCGPPDKCAADNDGDGDVDVDDLTDLILNWGPC